MEERIKIEGDMKMYAARVFLSRRNLLALLAKLDRVRAGDYSACTVSKHDVANEKYPQTHDTILVVAVEDEEYYQGREPGPMAAKDEEILASRKHIENCCRMDPNQN